MWCTSPAAAMWKILNAYMSAACISYLNHVFLWVNGKYNGWHVHIVQGVGLGCPQPCRWIPCRWQHWRQRWTTYQSAGQGCPHRSPRQCTPLTYGTARKVVACPTTESGAGVSTPVKSCHMHTARQEAGCRPTSSCRWWYTGLPSAVGRQGCR